VKGSLAVVMPALDEEESIGRVLDAIPRELGATAVVVDNGSTDRTAELARAHGAVVVSEPRRGYGQACLRGLAACRELGPPALVCFIDADLSDDPGEMPLVVGPILRGEAELVIGTRIRGETESGALLPHARFGNVLATFLLRVFFGARYTDLGPFRAITWRALERIGMRDRDFGWTVEMQVRAALAGIRHVEVPVHYRKRGGGRSKISGTVKGTILAGWKILSTIAVVAMTGVRRRAP
jgi:glycosyltransferase involved in cell wall biosynthesis